MEETKRPLWDGSLEIDADGFYQGDSNVEEGQEILSSIFLMMKTIFGK